MDWEGRPFDWGISEGRSGVGGSNANLLVERGGRAGVGRRNLVRSVDSDTVFELLLSNH